MLDLKQIYGAFLKQGGVHSSYHFEVMPKDCSKRQYVRIREEHSGKTYILMDSNLEIDSCKAFYRIAQFLTKNGFRAPRIYYTNQDSGLILLEDFGDTTISQALAVSKEAEHIIYKNAVDSLIQLAKSNNFLDLPEYDTNTLNKELKVFLDWTLKFLIPESKLALASKELFDIFAKLYRRIENMPRITVLRDYHADNLMLLNHTKQEIGLLDFQDALLGNHCYDLVSLLEDARRDVTPKTVNSMKEYYFTHCNGQATRDDLVAAYTIFGIQRNLKILGVFRRLNARDNNNKRMVDIPRVTGHILNNLNEPILKDVKHWFEKYIPQHAEGNLKIFLNCS